MNISIKINQAVLSIIKKKYKKYQLDNPNEYVIFFAQFDYTTISVFKNNKNPNYSLTITGSKEASIEKVLREIGFDEYPIEEVPGQANTTKAVTSDKYLFLEDQIGSDEVGTGDFFGPVTVVAALVRKEDIPYLKKLGVVDSKKCSDDKIRRIGKEVIKRFPYSSLTLDNKKYNELTNKGFNEVKIKVFMHNRALYNLKNKYPDIKNIYVDQFVNEDKYYEYLIEERKVVHDIYFHTKGESYFPSVALASVIARYSFLLHIDEINKKYKINVPLGSAKHVEEYAYNLAKEKGIKILDNIVKKHFKTYKRIVERLSK